MNTNEAISQLESLNKEVSIYSEAIDLAIAALEKQEQESDISCETCKHGRFGDEKCIGCWRRSCTLEDYYEPYQEDEA